MVRCVVRYLILVAMMIGSTAFARADVTSGTSSAARPPSVSIQSDFSPTSGTIGDRFHWHVAIRADDFSRLDIREPFTKSGDSSGSWTLVSRTETLPNSGKDGHLCTLDYTVTTFDVGETTSPRLAVGSLESTSHPQAVVQSAQVPVVIHSVLTDGNHQLQGVMPPVPLPMPLWFRILLLLVAVLVVLLIAFLVWKYMRRRLQKMLSNRLRPDETALLELEKLEKERLIDQKKYREFYTRLADAVRGYVGEAMELKSRDLTSFELLNVLERKIDDQDPGNLPAYRQMLERLETLLDEADLVKFARANPDVMRCRSSLTRGREIVALLKYRFEPEPEEKGPGVKGSGNIRRGTPESKVESEEVSHV